MSDDTKLLSIDFAAAIVRIADEENLSPEVVFNGLTIAASAMLVDYVAKEDSSIDQMSLAYAVTNFKAGLDAAVEFSANALKNLNNENNQGENNAE